jgi:hypothetical protein
MDFGQLQTELQSLKLARAIATLQGTIEEEKGRECKIVPQVPGSSICHLDARAVQTDLLGFL